MVDAGGGGGGHSRMLRHEIEPKIHSPANLAAARATCQLAAAARRSQARRRARSAQDAGVHLRPRLRGRSAPPTAARNGEPSSQRC